MGALVFVDFERLVGGLVVGFTYSAGMVVVVREKVGKVDLLRGVLCGLNDWVGLTWWVLPSRNDC